jgi:hypothetical protein
MAPEATKQLLRRIESEEEGDGNACEVAKGPRLTLFAQQTLYCSLAALVPRADASETLHLQPMVAEDEGGLTLSAVTWPNQKPSQRQVSMQSGDTAVLEITELLDSGESPLRTFMLVTAEIVIPVEEEQRVGVTQDGMTRR